MEISLEQIEWLLGEQRRLVVEKLSRHTHEYNTNSTQSQAISLSIDKDKFMEIGMKADIPGDIKILKHYGIK